MAQMRILLFQPPINPFQDSAKPTTTIINKIYVLLAFYSEWSLVALSGMAWESELCPKKDLGLTIPLCPEMKLSWKKSDE